MGRVNVVLPDDLDRQLRIRLAEQGRTEKGAISNAIAEALRLWMTEKQPSKKR